MPRYLSCGLILMAIILAPARADVGPPSPPPPAPPGPVKITIRGLEVERVYTYFRGRRWMTEVTGCGAAQPACKGRDLARCFVISANGKPIAGGETELLSAADKSSGTAPLKLGLDNCKENEIELQR